MVNKNRELGDFKELSKIRKQQCVNEFLVSALKSLLNSF